MALSLNRTDFQSPIRSLPLRENQIAIENFVNDLQSQIDNLATPPAGSEVTNARDYADVLRDRLRYASSAYPNVVISGGVVTEQSTPDMTVAISAGQAIVNGTVCVWDAQNSGTITAPSSNPRFDIVVINSDNSISIVAGTESADAVLPSISDSQKAVAILMLTSSTTSITSSEIIDARKQGAYYSKEGAYKSKFLIQDAINDAGSGDIYINQGEYYEEVDLSGKSDISLTYAKGANHYRTSDTAYCIKSVNTLGSESENISIRGASLHRNGKATQGMDLLLEYVINSSLEYNRYYDSSDVNDYDERTLTNTTNISEIYADTISVENVSATTMDADTISVDTISEKTTDNGVSIDGFKVKDGSIFGDFTNIVTRTLTTQAYDVTYQAGSDCIVTGWDTVYTDKNITAYIGPTNPPTLYVGRWLVANTLEDIVFSIPVKKGWYYRIINTGASGAFTRYLYEIPFGN